jgi:hypothetical protein
VSLLAESATFARFLRGLPAFLRGRINLEQAQAIVRQRMAEREANFLASVERGVFQNARSPYRSLLRMAGCEAADLHAMVHDRGVEGTLAALREAGVYVTFEEFKGTEPIVRGDTVVEPEPEDFDNPTFTKYYQVSTGGSTGRGRRVMMDLDYLTARLPMQHIVDDIHGFMGVPSAIWFEIPPGNGLDSVLLRVPYGNVPERWFTPIWSGATGPGFRFRAATQTIVEYTRLRGYRIPRPEYLPLDRAEVIARWAEATLRKHGRCGVRAHVSKVLRVALAAKDLGIDLTGATLSGGGEPPTPAKVRQIRETGARFVSNYYFTEAGPVGMGCTASSDPNDQHLLMDHLAMIQGKRNVPGFDVAIEPFCYTTLLATAPKLLLNVEIDDYGTVATRACGCPFEALGFTTHMSDIRSFRKLTGEGVTLIGSDMERILEEDLPSRFGGSPLDYQLVEEEDERGFTRLTLLVHPSVDLRDEQAVVELVLASLAGRGAAAQVSHAIWAQAGTLRVRREKPRTTSRGKSMPLELRRAGSEQSS